jgi:hypothetical protein
MYSSTALAEEVRRVAGARRVVLSEQLQALWDGYGQLWRGVLERSDGSERRIVVKHVSPPKSSGKDAAGQRARKRKLRSYDVEAAFYAEYAASCRSRCRLPELECARSGSQEKLLVLEDLDFAGFAQRRRRAAAGDVELCLRWLAAFHATFLGVSAEPLWKVGTYWHLATRPDELLAMRDEEVRRAAPIIDEKLRRAEFTTLVHGDAKLENFCFSNDASSVAALDFQYVGGGVGVKDVAYLLSSCFEGRELEVLAPGLLDYYFKALDAELSTRLEEGARRALESEWRRLYPYAWADLQRFLLGWAPEYARDAYALGRTREVLSELGNSREK